MPVTVKFGLYSFMGLYSYVGILHHQASSSQSFLLLYPEDDVKLPRVNSLLQPAIETSAHRIKTKQIYRRTTNKQGIILEKYYGYRRDNSWKFRYPCKIIKGGRLSYGRSPPSWSSVCKRYNPRIIYHRY